MYQIETLAVPNSFLQFIGYSLGNSIKSKIFYKLVSIQQQTQIRMFQFICFQAILSSKQIDSNASWTDDSAR